MGQPPRGRARARSRTCSSAAAALWALGVAVAVCTAFGIQRGGVDESDGTAGGHAVHAVRLQDADVAGGHRNARDEARAPPRGVSQTPACSLERYWARVEEYYDGNSAQQQAAARDSRPSPTRLFEQHHLCAAQQRQLGWHALHGGRRGEPASGPLGLSVMGVEGTGHHMTTFNSGVLWQAPVQVFAKLNLTVLETLSFPYSSRLEGKAGVRGGHYRADGKFGQRYLSRTDRTIVKMYPYERVWRSESKAYNFEDRFRDPRVLFVVLARDPVRSVLSNLGRFYTTVSGKDNESGYSVETEVPPFSDAAFELELRQQAVAYTNVELLAHSVPCGRLFLMPFELFLSDPCSMVAALWQYVGRGRYLHKNGTSILRWWQRQVAEYFARDVKSSLPYKLKLLDWEACKRHEESLGAEGYTTLEKRWSEEPTPQLLAAVERCEKVLGDKALHYFARLRFMWPLQTPFWAHALDPLRGAENADEGEERPSGEEASTREPLEAWQDPASLAHSP